MIFYEGNERERERGFTIYRLKFYSSLVQWQVYINVYGYEYRLGASNGETREGKLWVDKIL